MSEQDVSEVCAIVKRWRDLYGGHATVRIGQRLMVTEYRESLKPFLAKHGYILIDGYVCEEVRWKRT